MYSKHKTEIVKMTKEKPDTCMQGQKEKKELIKMKGSE